MSRIYHHDSLYDDDRESLEDPRVDMMREGKEKHGKKDIENAPPKPNIVPPPQPKKDDPYYGREE
jgi:hypothetical protein